MDVEKLFGDAARGVSSFDVLKLTVFTGFNTMADAGYPPEVILAMSQDSSINAGMPLNHTIAVLFDMWKTERSEACK